MVNKLFFEPLDSNDVNLLLYPTAPADIAETWHKEPNAGLVDENMLHKRNTAGIQRASVAYRDTPKVYISTNAEVHTRMEDIKRKLAQYRYLIDNAFRLHFNQINMVNTRIGLLRQASLDDLALIALEQQGIMDPIERECNLRLKPIETDVVHGTFGDPNNGFGNSLRWNPTHIHHVNSHLGRVYMHFAHDVGHVGRGIHCRSEIEQIDLPPGPNNVLEFIQDRCTGGHIGSQRMH